MPRRPRTKARLKRQENALNQPQGLFGPDGGRLNPTPPPVDPRLANAVKR